MTKKFDNMKLNDSKLIRKDISIKNLNSKFQKMEIGKKRTRASKVIKPKKKRKKNVTDVVLYDENFINNLFSIMDTIKKDRKYDINSNLISNVEVPFNEISVVVKVWKVFSVTTQPNSPVPNVNDGKT